MNKVLPKKKQETDKEYETIFNNSVFVDNFN